LISGQMVFGELGNTSLSVVTLAGYN